MSRSASVSDPWCKLLYYSVNHSSVKHNTRKRAENPKQKAETFSKR